MTDKRSAISADLANGSGELSKLQRQHGERLAAVFLDQPALNLLYALDREISIRWENLPDRTKSDWSETSRATALLAGANLCEVSPTRIRLSEYGSKLLVELPLAFQTDTANASQSVH